MIGRREPPTRMTVQTRHDVSYPYRIDPYRPDRFSNRAGKRPLVVVHGFSAQLYPMQALMHVLADQLAEKYCVYQYAFETFGGIVPNDLSLEEASRILGSELLRVQREDGLSDGVAFVGHSTGGLIARRCFIDHRKALGSGSFVFLGTPHQGAEIAELKNTITFTFLHHEKQTRELAAGSDFIWRLNRDWSTLEPEAIEKVLCVVGTKSDAKALGYLPTGAWVQADGVVRATSAALAPRPGQRCVLLHLPLDHGALKDIDPQWQKPGRVSRGNFEGPPVPTRDLPFMATVGFLKDEYRKPGETLSDPAALWVWCVDYLQTCELEWRQTVADAEVFERTPEGKWREKADAGHSDLVKVGLEPPPPPVGSSLPAEPTFKDNLTAYSDEVSKYWSGETSGAALVRLDYLNIPPEPVLVDLLDASNASALAAVANHPAASIRVGMRWATLYAPALAAGEHRIVWAYAGRTFEAKFRVTPHLTTLIEIDGFSGDVSDLTGEAARAVKETADGHAYLKHLVRTKKWDLETVKPSIDLRRKP